MIQLYFSFNTTLATDNIKARIYHMKNSMFLRYSKWTKTSMDFSCVNQYQTTITYELSISKHISSQGIAQN
jgi:hypothetical protein